MVRAFVRVGRVSPENELYSRFRHICCYSMLTTFHVDREYTPLNTPLNTHLNTPPNTPLNITSPCPGLLHSVLTKILKRGFQALFNSEFYKKAPPPLPSSQTHTGPLSSILPVSFFAHNLIIPIMRGDESTHDKMRQHATAFSIGIAIHFLSLSLFSERRIFFDKMCSMPLPFP